MGFANTPLVDDDVLAEIGSLRYEELGAGVVVFRGVLDVPDFVLSYIDSRSEEAHKNRWTYEKSEDGTEYALNEDGFKYRPEDVPDAPVRLLEPVNEGTEKEVHEYFVYCEDMIYKCLMRYIDIFPMVVGSLWWKTRGHILRYGDTGRLGWHQDNDTNYRVTGGVRYFPRGQVALRQTAGALAYFNNSVDEQLELDGTNFLGGHLLFHHLGIDYKPQHGDIIFFPTNYVCTHGVSRMHSGIRYAYLTFFGQGGNDPSAGIHIFENDESQSWCQPVWFDNIFDDYERFCKSKHSLWFDSKLEKGLNPVHQQREIMRYEQTHNAKKIG